MQQTHGLKSPRTFVDLNSLPIRRIRFHEAFQEK